MIGGGNESFAPLLEKNAAPELRRGVLKIRL
jgi:hypothetical protein